MTCRTDRYRRKRTVRAAAGACGLLLCLSSQVLHPAPVAYSWIEPKAPQSLLLAVAHNDKRWVAVGERGHVLVSEDAEHWRQVRVPTRVLLTAVDINDAGLGFAVGHDATIIRTQDDGDTWTRVYHAPQKQSPFLDVLIVDDRRVVAVGGYGLYAVSDDAGQSWRDRVLEPKNPEQTSGDEEQLPYDYHLNDIEIADSGRWYIAGEAGTVYRSEDRGATWTRLSTPYDGSFFGILPMSGDRLLVFGLQGRLFQSDDGGAQWTGIDTGTDSTLSAGLRLDGDKALILGYGGVVLDRAEPDGNFVRTILGNRSAFSDGCVLDNGDLLTVGQGGIHRWSADRIKGR